MDEAFKDEVPTTGRHFLEDYEDAKEAEMYEEESGGSDLSDESGTSVVFVFVRRRGGDRQGRLGLARVLWYVCPNEAQSSSVQAKTEIGGENIFGQASQKV